MKKLDPVDVAIDMLKRELPAFSTRFISGRDSIAISGALPIGVGMPANAVRYPLCGRPAHIPDTDSLWAKPVIPINETPADRSLRLAEERKAIERDVAPNVEMIVEEIQRFAIDAVNLEPTIARRVAEAERVGYNQGRIDGLAVGDAAGYDRGYAAGRSDEMRFAADLDSLDFDDPYGYGDE